MHILINLSNTRNLLQHIIVSFIQCQQHTGTGITFDVRKATQVGTVVKKVLYY